MVNEDNIEYFQKNNDSSNNVSERMNKQVTKTVRIIFALVLTSIFLVELVFIFKHIESLFCLLIILVPVTTWFGIILVLITLLGKKGNKGNNKCFLFAVIVIPIIIVLVLVNHFIIPFALDVKQGIEFFDIDGAVELFNSDFDGYPPSNALDALGRPYCGAMRLCEALLGQNLLGFHKESVFRSDGMNLEGILRLYPENPDDYDPNMIEGPYIRIRNCDPYRLEDIFEDTGSFDGKNYVLCDVYKKERHSGQEIGMPILYYKADTSKTAHDVNNPDNPENIYNYRDNYDLLALGVPGKPGQRHPLYEDPALFYKMTRNYQITTKSMPNREDMYILLSAGCDGLYGTPDDITDFFLTYEWN